VFERIAGQPIWPIEERPVPQSTVPGEKTSPTQPHVTKPPAYARNFLKVPDDVIDFTPEMRAQALEILKRYKNGPLFNPAIVGDINGIVGALQVGNAGGGPTWPGGRLEGELGFVNVQATNSGPAPLPFAKPAVGSLEMNLRSGPERPPIPEGPGPGFGTGAGSPAAPPPAPPPPAASPRVAGPAAPRRGPATDETAVRRALSDQSRAWRLD